MKLGFNASRDNCGRHRFRRQRTAVKINDGNENAENFIDKPQTIRFSFNFSSFIQKNFNDLKALNEKVLLAVFAWGDNNREIMNLTSCLNDKAGKLNLFIQFSRAPSIEYSENYHFKFASMERKAFAKKENCFKT